MAAKQFIINITKSIIAIIGFTSTFVAVIELTLFLSDPNYKKNSLHSNDVWLSTTWSLLTNISFLCLFILQHSVLASKYVKEFIVNYQLTSIYRSIYVTLTSITLLALCLNWYDVPDVVLWKFSLSFKPFWWLYYIIHVLSWLVIYVGNICMDINELLGIKQVYYSIVNLPDPNLRKSAQLRRLNSHMRHPSFLAFILIFWSVPVMSLDRLMLATLLTLYMLISWNTDDSDYAYQKNQYIRKFHELERLKE